MSKILFHKALDIAIKFIDSNYASLGKKGKEPVLLRDLYGRISIILQIKKNKHHQVLEKQLIKELGNFSFSEENIFISSDELFGFQSLINSTDKILIFDAQNPIYLVDRQITGQDWLRKPIQEPHPPRAVLFGIKGGVGRSTALAIWAWYLANLGHKVLVVDLDMESPGIGQILLPQNRLADFGIVDWLVEQAVGQADESLLKEMVATSPLAEKTEGIIRVVAAAGNKEQDYVAKLSRVYMDINQDGIILDFAHRISQLLRQLEVQESPDVVLLDSRAGIHDIAAIAITRLTNMAFLFAVNTPQTWQAYRYLFTHWQKWNVNLTAFRENLKIVASMIPELGREDYLSRCLESSYNLFLETIYEETAENELDTYNFALDYTASPHFPMEIFWNITFQEFNPQSEEYFRINSLQLNACYGSFLQSATELLLNQ